MKLLTFCIAIGAALTIAPGLMGCNKSNDTVVSIAITPTDQRMAKNSTQQFIANATFSNGMVVNFAQVVNWSSSNESVATVSNIAGYNGIVTSYGINGTTVLTAFDANNNVSGSATLTVTDPDSILIVPTNPYMSVGGPAHQFLALALFSGGTVTQAITLYATWTSLAPGVVAITDTPSAGVIGGGIATPGTVTGTANIQATDLNSSATGMTTITVMSTPLASLTIDQVNPVISLSTGTSQPFTAVGTFQDGSKTPSLSTTWAWTSSNTAAATINYYTGLPTAVAAGTTIITATDLITGIAGSTTLTVQ